MTPDRNDLETLAAMRRQAEGLTAARDPLLAGAVAQLIGIIDGLMRIAPPAATPSGAPPARDD